MKLIFLFLFVSMLSVIEGKSFLTQTETDIMLTIARHAFTKNFVLVPDAEIDVTTMNLVKILSKKQIQTISVLKKNLRNFLEETYNTPVPRAAIAIKENFLDIRNYFENDTVLCNYIWTFFDGSNSTLRHQLEKVYIPYDCLLILVEKIGEDKYYLNEYYSITKFSPGIYLEFGFWENNYLRLVGPPWYDRRSNMFGYKFVTIKFNEAMVKMMTSFDMFMQLINTDVPIFTYIVFELYLTPKDRVNENIWEELSYILNFRVVYKIIKFPSLEQPFALQPGEEALLDSQIYIGMPQKSYYLLGPVSQSKLFMHIRVPSEHIGLQRFIKPFASDSWLQVLNWLLYCSFFNFFVKYFFQRFTKSKNKQNGCFFDIFVPFYSLCVQSGGETNNTFSSRLVLFSTRISGTIIYFAYAATFRSFLVLYIPNLPFTDLKGFLENGAYSIEGERHSDLNIFFSMSPNPVERLVYEKYMTDVTKWSRFDKSLERMCKKEKLVLLGFDDDILSHAPCEILKISNPINTLENGFKIRFKSPFRGILHVKLLQLKSAGLLKRIQNKILYAKPKDIEIENDLELKLEKVISLFVIPIGGWIAGILILTAELIVSKIK